MKSIIVKKNQNKIIPIFSIGRDDDINYKIDLQGEGAEILCLVLLIGKGVSRVNVSLNVSHNFPKTKSRVVVKGVLYDSSSVNIEGLLKVKKGAKSSEAWFSSNLMLLSDQARGKAVPMLEISENELKAGHAATVGRVSEEELFYLRSRGLKEEDAKKLVVYGFLESLISEFPLKDAVAVRKKLKWI